MLYKNVYIDAIGYELAPHVVTSLDLERRLAPLYKSLYLKQGQLEAFTGIRERRFWEPNVFMYQKAAVAAKKALDVSNISVSDLDMLIYSGVCRDHKEPATACAIAHELGILEDVQIYDISNACLGILNGIIQVANAIELGQIQAGLIVSCESARDIVDSTIESLLDKKNMENFRFSLATLTGGSGAVAVIVTADNLSKVGHRLLGAVTKNAVEHHRLCWWDTSSENNKQIMQTDSINMLKHGVLLGQKTFSLLCKQLNWKADEPDKVICHQIGAAHQENILKTLNISPQKDFVTYPYLGNIGTVSLPLTVAIANEREFLSKGNLVGWLGIGSGLNCLMLGVQW